MSSWEHNFIEKLSAYVRKNESSFSFPELEDLDVQKLVWKLITSSLNDNQLTMQDSHILLDGVRILSRQKMGLDDVVSSNLISALKMFAKLRTDGCHDTNKIHQSSETIVKAQKALFNLIFNSPKARDISLSNRLPQSVIERVKSEGFLELPSDIKTFDLKSLFLISALQPESRKVLKNEADALASLSKLLGKLAHVSTARKEPTERISDGEADLISEVLKIIFNVTVKLDSEVQDPEISALISCFRVILLQNVDSPMRREELRSHTINVLTNIPSRYFIHLYIPDIDDESTDMRAIDSALELLSHKLDCESGSQMEQLTPVLTFFCLICVSHPPVRKYVRSIILPPLKCEVNQRPEDGGSLRNRLVKLMPSSLTQVAQLTARFLFVLCKENVGRLIKYTGYGNAAGLLAENGLMLGRSGNGEDYSDDSESSDTEEYRCLENQVNPITGCVEADHPDPMSGMTEEQKEHEAVNLLNLIDRLQRQGIVQPCRIGEDGRPEPVEHILQLQQELERPLVRRSEEPRNNNEDSD